MVNLEHREVLLSSIVIIGLFAALGLLAWRVLKGGHSAGVFAAKASGALFDLGVDVKRLSPAAKEKFFTEADALFEASKGNFHPKRFAMRFFGWYVVESGIADPNAFLREGVMVQSIPIMRAWGRQEPSLSDAAEREIKLVFEHLYRSFETMALPSEDIIQAQMSLLEMMKDDAVTTKARR
jgi:hypothetical protein